MTFHLPINYLDGQEHQFKFVWSENSELITIAHLIPRTGVGRVDEYRDGYLEGWALPDGHFGATISIDVYIDDIFFTAAQAESQEEPIYSTL